ncbi:hypothetical protein EVAR_97932_1 [Eumeta japonica]|uniref:Uncharacterized protein n=1 Tax=Eumeta variegata TaxID=151549 RepID=A0A4C1XXD1_EUMVA|nr:hypothetical protein EVAR_97932_1 [Eumeta japonica]
MTSCRPSTVPVPDELFQRSETGTGILQLPLHSTTRVLGVSDAANKTSSGYLVLRQGSHMRKYRASRYYTFCAKICNFHLNTCRLGGEGLAGGIMSHICEIVLRKHSSPLSLQFGVCRRLRFTNTSRTLPARHVYCTRPDSKGEIICLYGTHLRQLVLIQRSGTLAD